MRSWYKHCILNLLEAQFIDTVANGYKYCCHSNKSKLSTQLVCLNAKVKKNVIYNAWIAEFTFMWLYSLWWSLHKCIVIIRLVSVCIAMCQQKLVFAYTSCDKGPSKFYQSATVWQQYTALEAIIYISLHRRRKQIWRVEAMLHCASRGGKKCEVISPRYARGKIFSKCVSLDC